MPVRKISVMIDAVPCPSPAPLRGATSPRKRGEVKKHHSGNGLFVPSGSATCAVFSTIDTST
jgi:hypothetical protein